MIVEVDAVPEVRYVRSGDVNIAYTRWGQGAHVAVYIPPLASNVELVWESPEWARVCRHAGEHVQCVMIDKRGVGLSDRVTDPPTLDDRVADTVAVLAAEKLDAVDLVGHSEGGAIAIAFAVRYPERVRSLTVVDAPVWGASRHELAALADEESLSAILCKDRSPQLELDYITAGSSRPGKCSSKKLSASFHR